MYHQAPARSSYVHISSSHLWHLESSKYVVIYMLKLWLINKKYIQCHYNVITFIPTRYERNNKCILSSIMCNMLLILQSKVIAITLSVCLPACLSVCLSVCSRCTGHTTGPIVLMFWHMMYSSSKTISQGQGHHFCENHIMGHNFCTGSSRDFWLVAKRSL